ncbi:MAG: amidohydrolase [Acidimicrobiales bacterium]
MNERDHPGPHLERWLERHHDDLISLRRHLHAHPELSGQEHATTRLIGDRLLQAGLEPRVLSSGTGVICDVGDPPSPARRPPVIALRADMDALAMADEKDVAYRSRVPGVAHACGHDVHTTVVLATGLFLAQLDPLMPCRVRLIFQPAEERVPGGALDVIADGGLDHVDAVFGVHCDPKLDVGRIGLRAGAITSAADMAVITLSGPGGHTARPERTVDLVGLTARMISELAERVESHLDGSGPIKLVFGAVHGGDAANVIPSRTELRASVRTSSNEAWDLLPAAVEKAAGEVVAGTGATCSLDYTHGVPGVVNDPTLVDVVRAAAHRTRPPISVTDAEHSWGGDDFAWYSRQVPGALIRLGTRDPASPEPPLDLHAGCFDADERAIAVAVRLLVAVTREQAARRGGP